MSNVPASWNNSWTELPPQATHVDPPQYAELRKARSDRSREFVMGKCDTAESLFYRVYPEALTPAGRDLLGGASHLQAYLENLPGGYPKPGDVVNLPPFYDFIGKAKPEQLERINDRMAKEQPRCREAHQKEQSSRQSDGASRMAAAIFPRSIAQASALAPSRQNRVAGIVIGRFRTDVPVAVRAR